MKALLQRVGCARVEVDSQTVGEIQDGGLLVYLGVGIGDTEGEARRLAEKVAGLRIFEDPQGKMNLSVRDVGGEVLAIPNFTLMADARKGRRPTFVDAAPPEKAEPLYEAFVQALRGLGCQVETGRFRTTMVITSQALGPVNLIVEIPAG
jgi:D-aminoacyl-tRNA deacylase